MILSLFLTTLLLNAATGESNSLVKQRKAVMDLKKELNEFYLKKEKVYQKQKLDIKKLLAQVENEKREIEELYNKNKNILNDIEGAIGSKTSKIYNSMKPKRAAQIFDKMIEDGKIEDVFDIILKLKEKKVTLLLNSLSVENAAILTQMLENYSIE
ncbi:hypothetical protein DZA35_01060 [Arcobacter sp. HD9-500m-PIT-SAG03]|nr:hypothetical protein DZA35_01060 [Arcobacter sp. HD9-500m-PIT-SAG03]